MSMFVEVADCRDGVVYKVPRGGSIVVRGAVLCDPTPIAIPTKFKRTESLDEKIARMVRSEDFRNALKARDIESFEEADDFDVDDDTFDPTTPYEHDHDNHIISAMDRGVVQRPSEEQLAKSRSIVDKAVKFFAGKTSSSSGREVAATSDVRSTDARAQPNGPVKGQSTPDGGGGE